MNNKRKSGILLHPTSFPSSYGIGDLGQSAYNFIDFLVKAKQKIWQILPLGHTSFGDSPYQSFSTFAGNPLLISPDILVKKELLSKKDILDIPEFNQNKVDYGLVINYKTELYKIAYKNFKEKDNKDLKGKFQKFCNENSEWLDDYALFISLKNYFIQKRTNTFETPEYKEYKKENIKNMSENSINDCFYGASWTSWPKDIVQRKSAAINKWTETLKDDIEYYKFLQFEFFSQWIDLKKYANNNEIEIIGDIPIFVASDSADTWANKDLFHLDSNGYPTEVAGVPPDYFSETGQLWGNPLYDWEEHKKTGYSWWIKRIENTLKIVDILRIDHFRGFETYWSIPYGEKTAINGKWKKGPNRQIFDAINQKLGKLPIIAEDLGELTEEVYELRDCLEFPGMKILQFAFDTSKNDYLPHNYTTDNCLIYTGTHDNDTTIGWYNKLDNDTKDFLRRYLNVSGDDIAWDLIRLAFSSCARYAIIPIQDIMCLDAESRTNIPGKPEGNWQFRYTEDMLLDNMAEGLKYLSELFNRNLSEETNK